ncbi:hypothetical protein STXM2123_4836 [Streptomyces sp. F-3]|nr:hypothetical protein STXM2123_4836 [Streptomyces sp. F-3]
MEVLCRSLEREGVRLAGISSAREFFEAVSAAEAAQSGRSRLVQRAVTDLLCRDTGLIVFRSD